MAALTFEQLEASFRSKLVHLSTRDRERLAEISRRLIDAYQPEKLYLFGSKARGDHGPDSDFDLMVVVPDDAEEERRSGQLAYKALRGTGTAADVAVTTQFDFTSRLNVAASLPATVLREGKLLYGA